MSKILAEKYISHPYSLYLFTNRRLREWSYPELQSSELIILDKEVFRDTIANQNKPIPIIGSTRYFHIPFFYKQKL